MRAFVRKTLELIGRSLVRAPPNLCPPSAAPESWVCSGPALPPSLHHLLVHEPPWGNWPWELPQAPVPHSSPHAVPPVPSGWGRLPFPLAVPCSAFSDLSSFGFSSFLQWLEGEVWLLSLGGIITLRATVLRVPASKEEWNRPKSRYLRPTMILPVVSKFI